MRLWPGSFRVPARVVDFAPAAAATLAVFWGLLVHGEVLGTRDHGLYYWPVKSIFASLARSSAGLPFWNPFLASGQPFAANPEHAVFHPLTALFLLFPFETAYRAQIVLPVLLLAGSGFFLARALRLPYSAAAFSAVAWGFGGAAVSLLQIVPTLLTVAPLPAVLGYAVLIGRRGRRTDLLGFGVVYGLTVLGGEPPALLMGTLLSGVALLHGHRLADPEEGSPVPLTRSLGRLFLGGVLGTTIGAATLVPGLSHALKTVRAEGLDSRTAYSYTTPAARLAELVIPDAIGLHPTKDGGPGPGGRLYPGRGGSFLISIYPGLLLFAAAAVVWIPRGSPARVWTIPAAAGVLLALGPAIPLFPVLRALPILSGLRFPERFLLMTLASLTIAGTCGLSRLLEGDPRERRRAALSGAAALLAASWLAVATGAPAAFVGVRFVRQAAVLALGLGAIAFAARASVDSALRVAPAFLLAADLATVGRPLVGSTPPAVLRALPAPLLGLLKSPPRGYVFHAAAQDPVRGDLPGMANPPFLAQYGLATALDRDFDLTELAWSAHATGTVLRTVSALPLQAHSLLARRGIAAIVAFREDAPRTLEGARLREPSELLKVLEVPAPQPLAFVAERLIAAAGPAGWIRAVKAEGPSARTLAVVDPVDAPWSFPPAVSPGTVAVSSRTASSLALHVEAEGPGPSFVALNQTWDSGWEARLDGVPVPLVRTDLSLSGLLVPAGPHEVVLTYRSVPVVVGAGISLAGLLVTLFAISRGRRRPS